MRRRRSGQARPLADLLAELGERSDMRYGRRRLDTTQAIEGALQAVLGDDAAARCQPAGYVGTTAILACRSNASAQIVAMYLPQIMDDMRRRVAHADVQELRLTVAPEFWAAV
ncbi:MAG: DciA family protein [Chloroflexi bacterium]|nr:DciA family protein [Chloroflexota bacterium]